MIYAQIKHSGTTAWAPTPSENTFLAVGTLEGVIDENFQSHSRLEIFDVSPPKPTILSSIKASNTFSKLAWGKASASLDSSAIAAGMSDGSVRLWASREVLNPNAKVQAEDAALCSIDDMGFIATSLEFGCGEKGNHIAAASLSSHQIIICDIQADSTKTNNLDSKLKSGIGALKWNQKVPHILAAGNTMGIISIWDLRQNKAVMNVKQQATAEQVCQIAWNPSQALQLAVAYLHPAGFIWDLRKAGVPKAQLSTGTQSHFVGVDWNRHDPRLLLSAAEDGSCGVWSDSGSLLQTHHCGNSANALATSVSWAPEKPSCFSLNATDSIKIGSVVYAGDEVVPTWLGNNSGAKFSQFGQLVSFDSNGEKRIFRTERIGVESGVGRSARCLDELLTQGKPALFCKSQIEESDSDEEKTLWKFIEILFEKQQKQKFVSELGFEGATLSQIKTGRGSLMTNKDSVTNSPREESAELQPESAPPEIIDEVAFFDKIGEKLESSADEDISESFLQQKQIAKDTQKEITKHFGGEESEVENSEKNDEAFEKMKKSLVSGDFEAAVQSCLSSRNYADALIISSCNNDLWERTKREYLQQHPKRFMQRTMSLVMMDQIDQMVQMSSLQEWRQSLALVLTYSDENSCSELCGDLAERLDSEGLRYEAVLCLLCASDMEKLCPKLLRLAEDRNESIYSAMEKLFLCAIATNAKKSREIQNLLAKYLKTLLSQGDQRLAAAILNHFHETRETIRDEELLGISPLLSIEREAQINSSNNVAMQKSTETLSNLPNRQKNENKKLLPKIHSVPRENKAETKKDFSDQKLRTLPPKRVTDKSQSKMSAKSIPKELPQPKLNPQKPMSKPLIKPRIIKNRPPKSENIDESDEKVIFNQNLPVTNIPPKRNNEEPRYGEGPLNANEINRISASQKQKLYSLNDLNAANTSDTLEGETNASLVQKDAFESVIGDISAMEEGKRAMFENYLQILRVIEAKKLMGMEKRKTRETFEKFELLRQRIIANNVSREVIEKLNSLSKDLASKNFAAAKKRHVEMMAGNWAENKEWLSGINTLILLAKRHYK